MSTRNRVRRLATVAGVDKGAFEVLVAVPAPVVTDTIAVD